jgi:hypothetical protein
MKEILVGNDFFSGACGAEGDFLNESRFDGNFHLNSVE